MATCRMRRTVTLPGGTTISAEASQTGATESTLDVSIATGSTNTAASFTATKATLVLLYIVSDQAITIKTNSSGSPTDTFTLAANKALTWQSGDPDANPLTASITGTIYITNASGSTARVRCYALYA